MHVAILGCKCCARRLLTDLGLSRLVCKVQSTRVHLLSCLTSERYAIPELLETMRRERNSGAYSGLVLRCTTPETSVSKKQLIWTFD